MADLLIFAGEAAAQAVYGVTRAQFVPRARQALEVIGQVGHADLDAAVNALYRSERSEKPDCPAIITSAITHKQ